MTIRTKTLLHAALLLGAGAGLSGCVYDLGLGFASDGYYDEYDDGYGCDPYGGYDAHYDCDYGQGFGNIGFGGGWYDNYYYPGYGIFLFDNGGRRYPMREQYRRYWGEKRHNWYREHRGERRDERRYDGRQGRYNDGVTPGRTGWPDRQSGRAQDGDNDRREGRREGRGPRSESWRGGDGSGSGAVPAPNADVIQGTAGGLNRGDGYGGRDRRGNVRSNVPSSSPPPPQLEGDLQMPTPTPLANPAPPLERPERPDRGQRHIRENAETIPDQ